MDYAKRAYDLLRYMKMDLSHHGHLQTMVDIDNFLREFDLSGRAVAELGVLYIEVPKDFCLINELREELEKRVSVTLTIQIDYED